MLRETKFHFKAMIILKETFTDLRPLLNSVNDLFLPDFFHL